MSPRFVKIEHTQPRLVDLVYEQVLSAIMSGEIGPGDRLIQETLAEEINVSRTPVREALLRLEREGIIELSGRRGFRVRDISDREIEDIYQARQAIEGYAARLLADRGTEVGLRRISDVFKEQVLTTQDSVSAAFRANRILHRAIVEATGNAYLLELFDGIWGRSVAIRLYADLFNADDFAESFLEGHAGLLEALSSRDGDRAAEAMEEHIRSGLKAHLAAHSWWREGASQAEKVPSART